VIGLKELDAQKITVTPLVDQTDNCTGRAAPRPKPAVVLTLMLKMIQFFAQASADQMSDEERRTIMRRIAMHCDRLAKFAEVHLIQEAIGRKPLPNTPFRPHRFGVHSPAIAEESVNLPPLAPRLRTGAAAVVVSGLDGTPTRALRIRVPSLGSG
jgi:hypothetical protein